MENLYLFVCDDCNGDIVVIKEVTVGSLYGLMGPIKEYLEYPKLRWHTDFLLETIKTNDVLLVMTNYHKELVEALTELWRLISHIRAHEKYSRTVPCLIKYILHFCGKPFVLVYGPRVAEVRDIMARRGTLSEIPFNALYQS